MIDARLERSVDVAADPALGEACVAQADWDPRRSPGFVLLVLRPLRVQAWREVDEVAGRDLVRRALARRTGGHAAAARPAGSVTDREAVLAAPGLPSTARHLHRPVHDH